MMSDSFNKEKMMVADKGAEDIQMEIIEEVKIERDKNIQTKTVEVIENDDFNN